MLCARFDEAMKHQVFGYTGEDLGEKKGAPLYLQKQRNKIC